ncbi:VanZ family protein [Paenibacillus piri]|uniref:VanZ family protein n=1 Tax=Paenibacillus piri TaxID=2547395 RepID=A0A4R5KYL4_9BACL|nr:VanZ family protein [Paenibacillus piri]TDG00326.1 VanZ family protein [Paenibacillus piri]
MASGWKRWIYLLLAVSVCGLIFYLSQSPMFASVYTGRKIAVITFNADNVRELNFMARKGAHLSLFALLAVMIRSFLGNRRGAYLVAWLLTTLYGYADEFHQTFIPGRGASWTDVAIDSLGACIGLTVFWIGARLFRASR